MKISTKTRTAWISHPADPTFRVQVRHLKRIQTHEFDQAFLESQKVIAIRGNDGAPVMNEKTGEPFVYRVAVIPPAKVVSFIQQFVLGWDGLTDDDAQPIPFTAEAVANLMDEALDIHEDEGEKKSVTPFWQYLHAKAIDPKTFNVDPFAASSGGPQTA